MKKTILRHLFKGILNSIALPLRFTLSHKAINRIGLKSLKDERIERVLYHCSGTVIDIGCGEGNELINRYKFSGFSGIGIDVYKWDGVDIVCDTTQLPFSDGSFQTVTMVAVLNHIVEREKVLKECHRVLKDGGIIIITMLNPFIGFIRHKLAWWDKDQHERGMQHGEIFGMTKNSITHILSSCGFCKIHRNRFLYGLNNIYIAHKKVLD